MKHKNPKQNSAHDYVYAVIVGSLVGGVLGAIGGIFLPGIYYSLVNPNALQDGQFGLIYLASLPIGALIGAAAGIAFLCFITAKMHAEE